MEHFQIACLKAERHRKMGRARPCHHLHDGFPSRYARLSNGCIDEVHMHCIDPFSPVPTNEVSNQNHASRFTTRLHRSFPICYDFFFFCFPLMLWKNAMQKPTQPIALADGFDDAALQSSANRSLGKGMRKTARVALHRPSGRPCLVSSL